MKLKRTLALFLAVMMMLTVLPLSVGAVSCSDCGHGLTTIPAKMPTTSDVGWEEYQLCENCGYSTFAGFIPALGEFEITNYEEFVINLAYLEQIAYEYVKINPGKDALALVIKYIRTGVERYNSGSWGIMAGYEDTAFADFVEEMESMLNSSSTDGTYIKVTGLKNLSRFTLPNGDRADIGHVFGSMDITYHNKGSMNHADVSGWAGDLVDLLELSDSKGVSGDLDAMITDIAANYLGIDHSPSPGMSQEDIEGDLDSVYIMETLYDTDYYAGALAEIIMMYYTEDLTNEKRADFFLKNRLETTGTRQHIRNAVYNAYIGNKVISTLEGTREFTSTDLTDLRKAVCYAFADYLCKLAGDYVEVKNNPYYEVFESSSAVLAPGITHETYRATSADGKQMVFNVATADITRSDVNVYANYNNNDPSSWAMARVLDQANAAQKKYGDPTSPNYIKDYNVIVSTNADGYNMSTGEPGGLLIMDGKEWHGISGSGFFGITKDGKAIIGTTAEYNSTYRGQLQEAVGGFGTVLIKDGKNVVGTSSNHTDSRASRTSVGITSTGKVVLMVLDGRQEPYSCGGSMEEIAQIMFEAGCVHAVNLDGGGSSTFVAKLQGADELAVINSPSDGAARSVSTSLLMVSTAPSSTAFDHANLESDYNYSTIGTPVKLTPVGISATGNTTDLPEGYTWAVSDTRWGSISEDGIFTGLRNGSVEVYLMLDGAVIGSKTMNIVVPQSVYFTRENIDAVYGSSITLPIAALYEGKSVALSVSDITLTLDNATAGTFNGFDFVAAENSGIKRTKVTAEWTNGGDTLSGSIVVNIYKQGENTFDFDKATGGDRMLAYDRVVSNASNDGGTTYIAIDTDKDMVTSYIFAMDMTQIPIPKRLEDLIYMLPGADMENASAWNFLLQLAERISTLTEVTPVLYFDKNFDVDYSELNVMNEYFTLIDTVFNEEENSLTLKLRWIDQTAAIDPATANPLCLVNGIKLTPKADADWGANKRLNAVHSGKISYNVYLRASALYSFAQKPENQEVFGLLPFVNPDNTAEKGGYFGDIYKEFEDNYTLVNAKKNGWYAEDGGFTYYIEGVRMAGGVKKVEGYYYYFNDKGVNNGQVKYTGVFRDDAEGVYRFAKAGVLASGWQNVGNDWYYFDAETNAAVNGTHKIGGVKYEFDIDGKLQSGVWMNVFTGWRYYYGPDYQRTKWREIDGEWYYFRNGLRVTGKSETTAIDNVGLRRWYDFGEDGIMRGLVSDIVEKDGKLYWCQNGVLAERGLFKYNGDYYYSRYDGSLVVNGSYYAWKVDPDCDLPVGHYDFGPDGKMLGANDSVGESGIVEKDGVLYYYENGKPTEKGLFKLGNDYYYSRYNGTLIVNNTYYAYKVDSSCDLPVGTYEFGADGKMLNGIVDKNGVLYYYEKGVGVEKGLFKSGNDYYFAKAKGQLLVNETYYAWKVDSTCDLPVGTYEFGADGKMLNGIVDKNGVLYYYENGKPTEKGMFKYGDGYYYSRYNGSLIVGAKYYAYKIDSSCNLPVGNYEFGADGKMLDGIVDKNGVLYFYENGNPKEKFLFKYNGEYYYSRYNGALVTNGKYYAYKIGEGCDLPVGTYEFGADGKMLNGIVDKNGVLYFYENGNPKEKFLFKYNGDYYYSRYNGALVTNGKYYAYKIGEGCDLPVGTYEFGADGKMLQGIVEKDGVLYFYENGHPVEKGLFKYNGNYYYTRYNGSLVVGAKYYAYKIDSSCDLPVGTYEFDETGKMYYEGIIEKNGKLYYYEQGKPTEKGLFMIDGYYYYARYDGMIITNQTYYVWKGNDLLFEKSYIFNEKGQIIG